jgi:hypothetical protein
MALNGLPAVNVARPSKWGNPLRVGQRVLGPNRKWMKCDAEMAVLLFKLRVAAHLPVAELRGKNLACFCRIDEPCHADWLLEIANKP